MPSKAEADVTLRRLRALEPLVARFGSEALEKLTQCKEQICRSVTADRPNKSLRALFRLAARRRFERHR